MTVESAAGEKDAPGSAVLRVGSGRAGARLISALGRRPQRYWDTKMRYGGAFVVLAGDELEAALKIPGISKARLTVEDVARCI